MVAEQIDFIVTYVVHLFLHDNGAGGAGDAVNVAGSESN